MICLCCGWCCKGISPFGNPCPHLIMDEDIAVCDIYETRPDICYKHDFPASKCPIGLKQLNIQDNEDLQIRYGKLQFRKIGGTHG